MIPEYQQRVMTEADELQDKLTKLEAFLDGPTRPALFGPDEERRMVAQRNAMRCYLDILRARILAFIEVVHHEPTTEQLILDMNLTAPRITPEMVKNNVRSAYYFTAKQGAEKNHSDNGMNYCGPPEDGEALGLLTFCVLVLQNGFTVVGKSACASPENYNEAVGRKVARENAENEIWQLMGYELKCQLNKVKYHG